MFVATVMDSPPYLHGSRLTSLPQAKAYIPLCWHIVNLAMSNTTTIVVGSALVGAAILVFALSFGSQGSAATKKAVSKSSEDRKYIGRIPAEEVAKHCSEADAWIIVDGKVYDVTDYVSIHPGGDAILRNVGDDSSAGFHGNQHSDNTFNN